MPDDAPSDQEMDSESKAGRPRSGSMDRLTVEVISNDARRKYHCAGVHQDLPPAHSSASSKAREAVPEADIGGTSVCIKNQCQHISRSASGGTREGSPTHGIRKSRRRGDSLLRCHRNETGARSSYRPARSGPREAVLRRRPSSSIIPNTKRSYASQHSPDDTMSLPVVLCSWIITS